MQEIKKIMSIYQNLPPEWRTMYEMGNIILDEFKKQGYTGSISRKKEERRITIYAHMPKSCADDKKGKTKDKAKETRPKNLLAIIASDCKDKNIEVKLIETLESASDEAGRLGSTYKTTKLLPAYEDTANKKKLILLSPEEYLRAEGRREIDEARLKGLFATTIQSKDKYVSRIRLYRKENLENMQTTIGAVVTLKYSGKDAQGRHTSERQSDGFISVPRKKKLF